MPIDFRRPPDQPLSPSERKIAESHVAFLRQHRRALRLKLNATEALIVDGARSADHRGTLKRLFSKLDNHAVRAALSRGKLAESRKQQAEFLAGVAAISGDPGMMIEALEAQAEVQRRSDSVRAWRDAVRQLRWEQLSGARLNRLLVLLHKVMSPGDQLRNLFVLLDKRPFLDAIRRHQEHLEPAVADRFLPLMDLHQALRGRESDPVSVERAARRLFEAPPEVLRRQKTRVQVGLARVALGLDAAWPARSESVGRAIQALDSSSADWSGLMFLRAAALVRLGDEDPARRVLDEVVAVQPHDIRSTALRTHLDQPRIGRVAITEPNAPHLVHGVHLHSLMPVWVRHASAEVIETHRSLDVTGVAPIVDCDTRPLANQPAWFCVPGDPPLLQNARTHHPDHRDVGRAMVRLESLLAHLGITSVVLDDTNVQADLASDTAWLQAADLSGPTR